MVNRLISRDDFMGDKRGIEGMALREQHHPGTPGGQVELQHFQHSVAGKSRLMSCSCRAPAPARP